MSNDIKYVSKAQINAIRATFCVYVHIAPNRKLYFGLTSLEPKKRWYLNGNGYNNQKLFYRAIQKYGWDNFEHIILAKNLTKEAACSMEQNLIAMFESNNPKYGYNLTQGGEGLTGYTHTKRAKIRISKASIKNKSYLNLLKNRADRRKRCALVDKRGNIVYSFKSITECAEFLGISIASVSKNLKNHGTFGYLKFIEI